MKSFVLALLGVAAAKHHHHHHNVEYVNNMENLEAMSENALISNLKSTLGSALKAEARDDKAAAIAKTAAIKNIQKALTARILKRLDDGQPLVEVARKMKAIEGMQPQINDMERRLGIMQSVEPVLENAIKTLQKVVDIRGMGKKSALIQLESEDWKSDSEEQTAEKTKIRKDGFATARRIVDTQAAREDQATDLYEINKH